MWDTVVISFNAFMSLFSYQINFGNFSVSFFDVSIAVMVGSLFIWIVYKLYD